MPKVFLSSTFIEMKDYRTAAFEAIDQYGFQCVRMENFPAADREIENFCRDRVAECDLFLLILGELYGTPVTGGEISYTEDEFDTAKALKKSCLTFLPGPTARTNLKEALDIMEEKNLDYKKQKQRQNEFRQKALRGTLPRTFSDPTDLKFQVGHSISQYFRSLGADPPKKRYAGQMLPFLCDRTRQLNVFNDCFESGSAGSPEIYVLYGHESDQHHSCIRRLICKNIIYPTRGTGGRMLGPRENGAIISWPESEEALELAYRSLRRQLCESLNARIPTGYSVEAFCKLACEGDSSFLVFRHPLVPEEWTENARSLYSSFYLEFWSAAAARFAVAHCNDRVPRVIVFFEFKHRFPDDATALSFGEGLKHFFNAASVDGVRTRVLPTLSLVKPRRSPQKRPMVVTPKPANRK